MLTSDIDLTQFILGRSQGKYGSGLLISDWSWSVLNVLLNRMRNFYDIYMVNARNSGQQLASTYTCWRLFIHHMLANFEA
jgi:hypothetical protein